MNTKAKIRAVEKYNAKTYDRIYVRMKKADAEILKAFLNGRSLNGFINDAIQEKLERENGGQGLPEIEREPFIDNC